MTNQLWNRILLNSLGDFFESIYRRPNPLLPLAGEGSLACNICIGNLFTRSRLSIAGKLDSRLRGNDGAIWNFHLQDWTVLHPIALLANRGWN